MCRLFAYTTSEPEETGNLLMALADFRSLARLGCVPCGLPSGHSDGWGIVAYKDGAPVLYLRSVASADVDAVFDEAVSAIEKLQPNFVIGHLRKTTAGGNSFGNTQPFLSDTVSICHNGTIRSLAGLSETESDSLLFFRDVVRDTSVSHFDSFLDTYRALNEEKNFTAMNMLFSNGRIVAVARNWNEENPSAEAQDLKNYYTLYSANDGMATFISSEILETFEGMAVEPIINGSIQSVTPEGLSANIL